MAIKAANGHPYPKLVLGETISVAVETFREQKTRFVLTALGMVIGTASLILVVTIGLTGKEYILRQIQAIGANMMVANYQSGSIYGSTSGDYLTLEDMDAVRRHWDELPWMQRKILLMRFYGNMTQVQIADRLDCSQMHVSRLQARALAFLRGRLLAE